MPRASVSQYEPPTPARPIVEVVGPAASPEEVEAITAAVERFLRETVPSAPAWEESKLPRWRRAALLEGIGGGALLDSIGLAAGLEGIDPEFASPSVERFGTTLRRCSQRS